MSDEVITARTAVEELHTLESFGRKADLLLRMAKKELVQSSGLTSDAAWRYEDFAYDFKLDAADQGRLIRKSLRAALAGKRALAAYGLLGGQL